MTPFSRNRQMNSAYAMASLWFLVVLLINIPCAEMKPTDQGHNKGKLLSFNSISPFVWRGGPSESGYFNTAMLSGSYRHLIDSMLQEYLLEYALVLCFNKQALWMVLNHV